MRIKTEFFFEFDQSVCMAAIYYSGPISASPVEMRSFSTVRIYIDRHTDIQTGVKNFVSNLIYAVPGIKKK